MRCSGCGDTFGLFKIDENGIILCESCMNMFKSGIKMPYERISENENQASAK
jgi:ribosomal protein L37AE/L43A